MTIHSLRLALAILGAAMCVTTKPSFAATITVNNTADSGNGSLRAALAGASNGDTIDATGVSGTILLTGGQLFVSNSLAIIGPGVGSLAVNGNFPNTTNRVFHINPSLVVTIAGLTITNGHVSGSFPNNAGGAIYNDHSTLTLSNCTVVGNSADYAGGIYNDGSFFNSATVALITSTLSGNSANYGGGIYNDGAGGSATVSLSASTLRGNSVTVNGGGIINDSQSSGSATALLSISTISGNSADAGGGAIYNNGQNGTTTLTVANSMVISNSASTGGAVYSQRSTTTISNSTFGGNIADYGAAIYNDGFHTTNAALSVLTSTFSTNSASTFGGGIYNDGSTAGSATLSVLSSTFSGNTAGFGGAIYNDGTTSGKATVQVGDSILQAGTRGGTIFNSAGTITSLGYNLSSDNGGGLLTGTADQINLDPNLGPLQNNGGPTLTHALLEGSPALDQGKNLSGSTIDQRGFPRIFNNLGIANAPGGDGSDIGAVEVQNAITTPILLTTPQKLLNGPFQFSFTNTPGANFSVWTSTNIALPLSNWTVLGAPIEISPGLFQYSDPLATNKLTGFYNVRSP